MKILIIDDDKLLNKNLSEALIFKGFDVSSISSSSEYMEIEETLINYDAIILDLMMPNDTDDLAVPGDLETGEVVYKRIIKKSPATKILIISGKDKDRLNINLDGDNSVYLSKPSGTKIANIIRHLEK